MLKSLVQDLLVAVNNSAWCPGYSTNDKII